MPKKTQENRNMSGLRPLDTLSEEEAFAIRSKGGKASAAKREEERTLKSIIRKIMDAQPELSAEEDALLIRMGISKEKIASHLVCFSRSKTCVRVVLERLRCLWSKAVILIEQIRMRKVP